MIEEEVPVEVEYEEEVTEDREVEEDVVQEIRVPQVKALYRFKGQGLGIEKGEVRNKCVLYVYQPTSLLYMLHGLLVQYCL